MSQQTTQQTTSKTQEAKSKRSEKSYISFCTTGMPMKNQIDAVRGVKVVYNYLNKFYDASTSRANTWHNPEITLQIETTGCTGFSDILFSKVVNRRWKIIKTITIQDYYNEILKV